MNIAEVTTYKEGGVYTHVAELVKRIDANILIITGNTTMSGYQQENGLSFYHIPCKIAPWMIYFINPLGSYKKVKNLLKKHEIKLIHFHNPLFTFSNGLMNKHELPMIMTAHYVLDLKGNKIVSFIFNKIIKLTTLYISKKVDKIICVNKDYIPIFTSWGVDPDKLVFIPNGVDTNRFTPGESKIKQKYRNSKLMVFFGRLHYQKNVDLLIRSFKLIEKQVDNVKLVIIGGGPDIKRLKKISTFSKNIIFTGYVSDEELLDYLRGAYIAVFPSRAETASLTLLESMACGLPVVFSDVGNARKILADGRGMILDEYTEKDLAEKCINLLKNEGLAKDMGVRAMEFVRENYSLDVTCEKTEELYETVIEQNPFKAKKKIRRHKHI